MLIVVIYVKIHLMTTSKSIRDGVRINPGWHDGRCRYPHRDFIRVAISSGRLQWISTGAACCGYVPTMMIDDDASTSIIPYTSS